MSNATTTRPSETRDETGDVSLALAWFQSHGDPAMQCFHGLSLFEVCRGCGA